MQCLICNAHLNWQPDIWSLLRFSPLKKPVICEHCTQGFTKIGSTSLCAGCGRQRGKLCDDCRYWQSQYPLIHNKSIYCYNLQMKEYMQAYKFTGDYRLRMVFQNEFTNFVKAQNADIVIPIPVSNYTMQTRGFNQVCGLLDIPVSLDILKHKFAYKGIPQSAKTRRERLITEQPFKIVATERLEGQSVLLVDDIYTTGRTIYHAANLCYQAGCKSVRSITLAS